MTHRRTSSAARPFPILFALTGVLLAAVACGDGDSTSVDPNGASVPDGSGAFPQLDGDYEPTCDGYMQKMRDCGLLTEGEARCFDLPPDLQSCFFDCFTTASCSVLAGSHCRDSAPPLATCLDECQVYDCGDGTTILRSWVCDNAADCLDGRDEVDCEYFECENGGRVRLDDVCDGFPDCLDVSDEQDCPTFTCANGVRIPEHWRCDFEADCGDASDEAGCPHFTCESNGKSVPPSWRCDLEDDCLDGSDELGCAQLLCR